MTSGDSNPNNYTTLIDIPLKDPFERNYLKDTMTASPYIVVPETLSLYSNLHINHSASSSVNRLNYTYDVVI